MRYVEITHTYVIPVPAEDQDVIEPLAREGMMIMEGFMKARATNIRELRSDWKMMPAEFSPRYDSEMPRAEVKRGPTIPHPWDEGMRFLPDGHPMFDAETQALEEEGMLCGEVDEASNVVCVGVKGHKQEHIWVPRAKAIDA